MSAPSYCPYCFDDPIGSGKPMLLDGRYWCVGHIEFCNSLQRMRCPEDCPFQLPERGAWRAIYDFITSEDCFFYTERYGWLEVKGLIGWYWYAVYPFWWREDHTGYANGRWDSNEPADIPMRKHKPTRCPFFNWDWWDDKLVGCPHLHTEHKGACKHNEHGVCLFDQASGKCPATFPCQHY